MDSRVATNAEIYVVQVGLGAGACSARGDEPVALDESLEVDRPRRASCSFRGVGETEYDKSVGNGDANLGPYCAQDACAGRRRR